MSAKFIVICGPALFNNTDLDEFISSTVKEYKLESIYEFPEHRRGANQVRLLINRIVEDSTPALVITRYEHTVSQFAELVVDNVISHSDVIFRLVRYTEIGIDVTDHQIINNALTNNWPIGILW